MPITEPDRRAYHNIINAPDPAAGIELVAVHREAGTKIAHRNLEMIYHVIHAIHDQCEDEGDRIYLGSTNDRHTLLRQLRRLEKLLPEAALGDY